MLNNSIKYSITEPTESQLMTRQPDPLTAQLGTYMYVLCSVGQFKCYIEGWNVTMNKILCCGSQSGNSGCIYQLQPEFFTQRKPDNLLSLPRQEQFPTVG